MHCVPAKFGPRSLGVLRSVGDGPPEAGLFCHTYPPEANVVPMFPDGLPIWRDRGGGYRVVFRRESAAMVRASTPVDSVGSRTGANNGEWLVGTGRPVRADSS